MKITFPTNCVAIIWSNNEINGICKNFVTEENLFGAINEAFVPECDFFGDKDSKLLYLKEPNDVEMNCGAFKSFEIEGISGREYVVEVSIEPLIEN